MNPTFIYWERLPGGRIRLEHRGEAAVLDFGFRVAGEDGRCWTESDFPEPAHRLLQHGEEFVYRNDVLQVVLELAVQPESDYVEWRLRLKNEADCPLTLASATMCEGQLYTRQADSSVLARGEGMTRGERWRALNAGLQSTDMHVGVEAVEPGRTYYYDGFTVLYDSAGSKSHMLAGCSSHASYFPHVLIRLESDQARFEVCITNKLEALTLQPGDAADTEWAVFMADSCHDRLLSRFMDRVCASMSPTRVFSEPATGWISWYYYYGTVTEQAMLDNVQALRQFPDIQPEYVVIDAGWFLESGFGDWEPNGKFPHGMKWLAERIAEAGFKPGLWFSPLLADAGSMLVREHPDWLLWKDGQPVAGMNPSGSDVLELHEKSNIKYVLDITNAEVLQYLHRLIHRAVHEWGYRYIKLDFLVRALFTDQGTHSSLDRDQIYYPGTTTARAYRNALRVIREAAGADCFILGCAAPLFASMGHYMDANRMTPDITRRTYTIGQERPGYWQLVKICGRAMAARYFMHPRAGFNDPDALVVRGHEPEGIADDYTPTLDEARVWAGVVALSGGLLFYNDNLTKLEEERRPIISQLFPVGPGAAVPIDYFELDVPRFWRLPVRSGERDWIVLGVFNWSDESIYTSISLRTLGFGAGQDVVGWDLWERRAILEADAEGDDVQLTLGRMNARSMRMLALRPAASCPQLLGTDMHFTQGWAEFADESWDGGRRRLSLRWRPGYTKRGTAYVYVPEPYRGAALTSNARISYDGGATIGLQCLDRDEPLLWVDFDLG